MNSIKSSTNKKPLHVRVKVCGITRLEDAQNAIDLGADALGFIFCQSPRQIDIPSAKKILLSLPSFVNRVAVLKDPTEQELNTLVSNLPLDTLQFHGEEPESFCLSFSNHYKIIKTISIRSSESLKKIREYPQISSFLLDSYSKEGGGSGRRFNWNEIQGAIPQNLSIILAGGLSPENILEALSVFKPYAVDVNTGVEYPHQKGIKDLKKMQEFFQVLHLFHTSTSQQHSQP